jgi:hypothetical protein
MNQPFEPPQFPPEDNFDVIVPDIVPVITDAPGPHDDGGVRGHGGRVGSLAIAGLALAILAGGWFLLSSRTGDAGPADGGASTTDAPPTLSEIASQTGAMDAADKFADATDAPVNEITTSEDSASASTVPEFAPSTTAPLTVIPATPPPTTVAPTPAVTVAPTTVPAVTAAPAPTGPRVEIVTRTAPCKFGSSCLVAGFVLHGFDAPPSEFVCEFASGNRFTFNADTFSVEQACATGTPGDSITIEVGGIRSQTIQHG